MESLLETLFWGEELEVEFRGSRYFIQGYYKEGEAGGQVAHMEAFTIEHPTLGAGHFLWQMDAAAMSVCATAFLRAKIWDGMDFIRAEREIEWIG